MGIARVDQFISNAIKKPTIQIETLCRYEMDYLRKNYVISSMRRVLTMYRNDVKKSVLSLEKQKVILEKMVLNDDEKMFMAKQKNDQLSRDLTHLRPLKNIDEMIQVATDLLSENSYMKQVIGLCLLTGRRSAEIGSTAHFEPVENDPLKVLFTGQLKTKGRGELPAFEIPVLCESDKIIQALNSLRLKKPNYVNQPEKFHSSLSKDLGKTAKKAFGFVCEDYEIKVKDLRSIYAEINYFLAADRRIAKPKYMSLVLGHGENDNETGSSYVDFYIDDENYN